jgi:nicotinic acid mononucleotide adenylyltransferase
LRVGTAALLDLLRIEEPDTDFTFAMGADTFIDLTDWKWKRSKDILKEQLNGRIVVFQRPSNEAASSSSSLLEQRVSKVNREEGAGVRIFQLNDSLSQGVSSTLIRSIRTREDLEGLVAPRVQDYIVDKKLYGFAAQED